MSGQCWAVLGLCWAHVGSFAGLYGASYLGKQETYWPIYPPISIHLSIYLKIYSYIYIYNVKLILGIDSRDKDVGVDKD